MCTKVYFTLEWIQGLSRRLLEPHSLHVRLPLVMTRFLWQNIRRWQSFPFHQVISDGSDRGTEVRSFPCIQASLWAAGIIFKSISCFCYRKLHTLPFSYTACAPLAPVIHCVLSIFSHISFFSRAERCSLVFWSFSKPNMGWKWQKLESCDGITAAATVCQLFDISTHENLCWPNDFSSDFKVTDKFLKLE